MVLPGCFVKMAKEYAPFVRKIEVEVETFDMVKEAVVDRFPRESFQLASKHQFFKCLHCPPIKRFTKNPRRILTFSVGYDILYSSRTWEDIYFV